MKSLLFRAMIAFAAGVLAVNTASAAIVVDAYYHLGESDLGAVASGPGNAVTIDSSGNSLNLSKSGSPTYSSDVAAHGSTLSMSFNGSSSYGNSTIATAATDNFGIEGYFKPRSASQQDLAYNGGTGGGPSSGGFGLYIFNGHYEGLFGGVALLDSGVAVVPNQWTYFALVRDNGVTSLYIDNTTPITPTNSAAVPAVPLASLGVHIGATDVNSDLFTGLADEVRIFTFAPGQFTTQDLLIATPEPSSVVALCGLGAMGLCLFARRRRKS